MNNYFFDRFQREWSSAFIVSRGSDGATRCSRAYESRVTLYIAMVASGYAGVRPYIGESWYYNSENIPCISII
jgi:hypothetical protein